MAGRNVWAIDSALVMAIGFDSLTGSAFLDSSGRGNHYTPSGDVTAVPGQYGVGRRIGPAAASISKSAPAGLSTTGISISIWAKWNFLQVNPSLSYINLIFHNWPLAGGWILYFEPSPPTGRVVAAVADNTATQVAAVTATPVPSDSWAHYVVTFDNTELKVRLYINGSLVATSAVAGATTLDAVADILSSINIPSFGAVDDALVFGRKLAPEDVSVLYSMGRSATSFLRFATGEPIETLGNPFATLVTVWDAGLSAGQVVLEGSADGSNWYNLATRGFVAASTQFDPVAVGIRYVRARVSTAPVGGGVRAWVTLSGAKKSGGATGQWWTDDWPVETGSYYGINPNGQSTGTGLVASEALALSYDMETLAAGKMKDFSPFSRDGTIVEATDVAGKFGRARQFDGVNDEIQPGVIDPLLSGFTVSAWFKWTTNPTPTYSGIGTDATWDLQVRTTGAFVALFYQNTGFPGVTTSATSPLAYNDGNWHHAAAVLRNQLAEIWVDGVMVAAAGGSPIIDIHTGTAMKIGMVSSHFNGSIDEVLVFTKALTGPEIQALANRRR